MPIPDVKVLYAKYNVEFFNEELPEIEVVWNDRYRTRGGTCHLVRKDGIWVAEKISLNQTLLSNNEDNLRHTLIHEMVHVWRTYKTGLNCGHDYMFQSKMDEIFGYKKSHTYHSYDVSNVRERRLIECHCPVHGVIASRARMPTAYNMNRYHCNRKDGVRGKQCNRPIKFVDTRKPKRIKSKKGFSIGIKVRKTK